MARYCGYCGRPGHNRRTCPHRSEEQKQSDKTWHMKPGPRSGGKSICSYCGGEGHNRRTCWHLKHRISRAEGFVENAVCFALSQYSDNGLGPGALYERTDRWYNSKATYLVTDGVSLGYCETVLPDADYQDEYQRVPTFSFTVMGNKVFGDRTVERDIGPAVDIKLDLKNKMVVSHTARLRSFMRGTSEGNIIVGKAHSKYSEELKQRLRDWAYREIREFFSNKENQHPMFGEDDRLNAIRAEAEAQEKMK